MLILHQRYNFLAVLRAQTFCMCRKKKKTALSVLRFCLNVWDMFEIRLKCCMWKFWYFSIARIWESWSSSCLRILPRFWSDRGEGSVAYTDLEGASESCSSDSHLIWSWFLFMRPRRLMGKSSKNNWPRDQCMPFISNIRTIQTWMLFSCSLLNPDSALLPLLNCYNFS